MRPAIPVHDDPLTQLLGVLLFAWPLLLAVSIAVVGAALSIRLLHRLGGGRIVVAVVWVAVMGLVGYVAMGRWVGEVGLDAVDYLRQCGSQRSWQIAQGMWAERTTNISLYVQSQDKSMNACVEEWGWRD